MENTNTKWFAAGLGMLIIMMLFSVTNIMRNVRSGKALDEVLTISMPRPIKEMIIGFSLEGRNILREVEATLTPVGGKKSETKPLASGTKSAVDKGAKPKLTAQQKLALQRRAQVNEMKRRAFQARVIEQAERYRQSLTARAMEAAYIQREAELQEWKYQQAKDNPNPAKQNTDEDSDRLTASEWVSLILAQPTEANVSKMIKALSEGEIDRSTYLDITEKLIKDNSQEKKRLGIWALTSSAAYGQDSFTLASHIAVESGDANTQKLLTEYMESYNNKRWIGVFDQVLKSQDTVAATAASQAITKSINNIRSNQNDQGSTGRNGNRNSGSTVQQLTLDDYKSLIPTLKIVSEKNLHNLSQWANTLLSQLQTTTTPS